MPFQKGYTPWNKKDRPATELKDCGCGCGEQTEKYDSRGRERTFIYGHGSRGRKFPGLKHDKQFKKGDRPWNLGMHVENGGTFKRGHTTNLGRKHPPEFGKKISKAQRGKAPTHFGENHWNWKGGITPTTRMERQRFRETVGRDVLRRDDYTCTDCKAHGVYLHVDHIKPWAEYPELRFDPDNCRTLCVRCHYRKTFGREMPEGANWARVKSY